MSYPDGQSEDKAANDPALIFGSEIPPLKNEFGRDVDVAERWRVHRSTVWRWVREKIIPAPIKVAGTTRFNMQAVDRAILEYSQNEAA